MRDTQLQGWARAKALGDIGRELAFANSVDGQVTVVLYAWQRDLLAEELEEIEDIGGRLFTERVLGAPCARPSRKALSFWSDACEAADAIRQSGASR
jgi:hypothetical protein